MLAEIVKHFYPRLVDLHNYVPTCNTDQKLSNWSVLNRKVFHKLRLWVSETEIQKVVANTPGAIEPILLALREKVKDGAVQQAPPPTADPGPSSADANSPQAQLTTPAHTGLQGPTVPSGVKTLPSQRTPERTGHCVYIGQDPADGSLEHLDSGLQQLLEEKEQALVVLQEMVKESDIIVWLGFAEGSREEVISSNGAEVTVMPTPVAPVHVPAERVITVLLTKPGGEHRSTCYLKRRGSRLLLP
ncbi:sperm flagellar protein 1-like [Ursus arctos]|nr:sperm flagellar protein 1-like [Ursus arctos]